MAARSGDGGFGPSSLLGANTITMSTAPTIDRQSSSVAPLNPAIKFEEPFLEAPRIPTEKAGGANMGLQTGNASSSDAGTLPVRLQNDREGGANWWLRLMDKDRKNKSTRSEGEVVDV